jgi:hypothetical protein
MSLSRWNPPSGDTVLRRLLLGLALCGIAHAQTPAPIELAVTPALKGWSRPGRASELDIRLSSTAATHATLDLVAGKLTVHTELDLVPGRVERLHIPLAAVAAAVTVTAISVPSVASAGPPTGRPERRDIGIALSETPLLGVGLATDEAVALEGFHTVVLAADDLPRHASAYSSIDALILDTPTLRALDQRQLAALLAHAAGCGRIAVVNTDAEVGRLLDSNGACGGQALMTAPSVAQARQQLQASLALRLPGALSLGSIGDLARPDPVVWNRLAVGLALYFTATALAILFFPALPALLLTSALASLMAITLPHALQPASRLVVWSEGESGARLARFQAWQRHAGLVRGRARVPVPPQLASAVQPCDPAQPMRLDVDAGRSLVAYAEFDTRLFRQVSLCYAGSFPMSRALAVQVHSDGGREVRNAGGQAWPAGVLLARGTVHDLPAVGPGAHSLIGPNAGQPPANAALRLATARLPPDRVAALWPLELGGVAGAPADSQGWLLVSVPSP